MLKPHFTLPIAIAIHPFSTKSDYQFPVAKSLSDAQIPEQWNIEYGKKHDHI
jgi:hypothetical protein